MMDKNMLHPQFYPRGSLGNKQNMKRVARVYPDGSIVERVYLDVADPRYREQLICLHYLKHITKHFLKEDITIKIIGRDNPWDFRLELNTSDVLNIEIVSVADNRQQYKINKAEERYNKWCMEKEIPLYELTKLLELFPDNERLKIVSGYTSQKISPNELVKNPYYPPHDKIFVSTAYETSMPLAEHIINVVNSKIDKNHPGKDNTVIIIDNRTGMYDVPDYFKALEELHHLVEEWPFPEIWFYTGYYSDDAGCDAEFSFAPIKATFSQGEKLEQMTNSDNMDDGGTYVW